MENKLAKKIVLSLIMAQCILFGLLVAGRVKAADHGENLILNRSVEISTPGVNSQQAQDADPPKPTDPNNPNQPVAGYAIAKFDTDTDGFDLGTQTNGVLELRNPNYGDASTKKIIDAPILKGFDAIEFDINLNGKNVLDGDAGAIFIDQSGQIMVELKDKVINGHNGWQHVKIPLSEFTGLNITDGIASITFRLWHQTSGIYYIDNIVLSNANGDIDPPTDPADPPGEPEEPITTDGVPNNSLEQMYNDSPIAWNRGGWGENSTSFEYLNSGRTGNHSVKIMVTNFVNGDAKWYFNSVSIDSTKQYEFSNYYQSDTNSDIIAELKDASGNISYLFLTTLSASMDWLKTSVQFEVPAGTVSITIFHLIASNGFLITDDYSLKIADSPAEDPKDPFENLVIPNNGLEEITDTNSPTSWNTDKWGENTTTYEYLNTGYNSNHSVKTTITNYESGDAKWFFVHQNITPGQTYRFSDYYQSNIPSQVIVEVIKNDGNYEYLNLKIADASTIWKQYIDTFSVPIGAAKISIFHLIAGVGFLITDNYSLAPYQTTSLEQPIISLTFDDGWEDNYFTALPILNQYGFKSTQYYATTFIENNIQEANTKITKFVEDGHEIGSHSITHPDFKLITDEQLELELLNSKATLESFAGIGKVESFATPYGSYDARVITAILKYYQSHRSTDAGFNTKDGLNTANIKVQNMTNYTTLDEYSSWVNKAVTDKAWLVIIYHKIVENPGQYDTYLSDFIPQMDIVKNSEITVLPVSEAISKILLQIA